MLRRSWFRELPVDGRDELGGGPGALRGAVDAVVVERHTADAAVGVQWLERAARAGHTQAKYELALHYLNGEGVQADEAMAITLLRDAAQAGHRQAETKLKAVYAAAGLPLPALTRSPPQPAPVQKVEPFPAPPSASVIAPTTVTAPAPAAEHDSDFERGERHATRGAMAGMMADAAAE